MKRTRPLLALALGLALLSPAAHAQAKKKPNILVI
jgi:hypothetical protein